MKKPSIKRLRRKSRGDQLVKAARDLELPSGLRPPKAVKSGAAAVVAATAASAAISAVRRRLEPTEDG
jgi:hypothetical protein